MTLAGLILGTPLALLIVILMVGVWP